MFRFQRIILAGERNQRLGKELVGSDQQARQRLTDVNTATIHFKLV